MNQEIKVKWLAWLRDPQNKQTTQHLRTRDGYCCLGGLCTVLNLPWISQDEDEEQKEEFHCLGEDETLPRKAQELSGLTLPDPKVTVNGREYSLSQLNDGVHTPEFGLLPHTFQEIADIIEAQL